MVVNCEQVWREISNYLDNDIDASLRGAIEEHIRTCKKCKAVLDGTRNLVELYGDERMVEIPLGFDRRLHRRLEEDMSTGRRVFLGWMVAAAAAVIAAATFEVASMPVFRRTPTRSEHAQQGQGIPPDLAVIVEVDGKTFHVAGCPYIHDKNNLRTMPAKEAIQLGYAPCVRCLKKYVTEATTFNLGGADGDLAG